MSAILQALRSSLATLSGRVPGAPLMAFVELTRRCNLRCSHCDIWQTGRKDPDFISRELPTDRLLEVFRDMRDRGLVAADLFGGEPLLRRDLPSIVTGLKELGLHVTITTNGVLLAGQAGRDLIAARPDQILVSVDFPTAPAHDRFRGRDGTFERCIEGLRTLADVSPSIQRGINVVIVRDNLDRLPEMVHLASELGCHQIRFLPYHDCYPFSCYVERQDLAPRGTGDLRRLECSIERVIIQADRLGLKTNSSAYLRGIIDWYSGSARPPGGCKAGLLVCDINAAGLLYPCYTLGRPFGDLHETDFSELWRSPTAARHRDLARTCARCWQSCYIEPGLRLSPSALLADPMALLRDIRDYL